MFKVYRNIALVALLVLSVSSATFSQNMYGIKGGLSSSSFWGDGVDDFEDNLGVDFESSMLNFFTGGVFARYEIVQDFLAIQPEILYLRSGKQWTIEDTELNVYNDYISVPVLVKLLIPFDPITPNVYVGPVVNFRLRSRADGIEDVPDEADLGFLVGQDEDISDGTRGFDIGLATGIGVDIEAGPGAFILDFRVNFGFVEIFDDLDGDDIRNISFQIMAGYGLEF
ncbi:porin family protein [Chitinispirillales bacterium ANBcel5]|uniref:porin family protein n=1 Tax=Cellulosispirillum alkaliphilum TaxID=3039283 RepID=UPI002A4E3BBE|nr:porin family protein [Chitinispirillales bacterium ANBcel5]